MTAHASSIVLPSATFPSAKDCQQYFSRLLACYRDGQTVRPDDAILLGELLMLHPDAARKIGCGIESFFVAQTGYGNLGFHIKRSDGSWDNLSYRKCISAPSQKSRVLGAFRCVARPWLTSYSDQLWESRHVGGLIPCAETGEFLPRHELKLDHRAPRTFEAIAHAFLTVICKFPNDAPWHHVELRPPEDQDYEHLPADDKLSELFIAKHAEWSTGHLEFVERHINMALKNGLR